MADRKAAAGSPVATALVSPAMSNALSLQRTIGNQATAQLMAGHGCGCGEVVQRHSSWEHSLLGDAKPEVLAQVGTWEDVTGPTLRDNQKVDVTVPGVGTFDKGQIMHTLAQEMTRIKQWQDAPPEVASTDDPYQKTKKDPTYDVFVVRLPAEDPSKSMLITYGELNTLADFYGNIDVMKSAAPKQRRQIVQSVRRETFLQLRKMQKFVPGVVGSELGPISKDKKVHGADAF